MTEMEMGEFSGGDRMASLRRGLEENILDFQEISFSDGIKTIHSEFIGQDCPQMWVNREVMNYKQ